MSTSQQFWGSPEKWPVNSVSYVFLARAIGILGKIIFEDGWTGAESTAEHFNLNRALADPLYLNNFLAKHAPNAGRVHFDPPVAIPPIIGASGAVINFDRPVPSFKNSADDLDIAISLANEFR